MQLKPAQWTHHHTHRLFHISMGLCFGFISLVLIAGMGTALFSTNAEDVAITAMVDGVTTGPITPGHTTSGSIVPKPVPKFDPTITIWADPQGYVPKEGQYYIFDKQRPEFSGLSSVSNGLIFITVRGQADLNSTTRANSSGDWYWQSPELLPVGTYHITAAVFELTDLTRSGSAQADFKIKIIDNGQPLPPGTNPGYPGGKPHQPTPPSQPSQPGQPGGPIVPPNGPITPTNSLFGVFLNILPNYKTIEQGQKVMLSVTLASNSGEQLSNQDITFQVISPSGKTVLQTVDTVAFSKYNEFTKTFFIAPATPVGEYTVLVTMVRNGMSSVASDTFNIKPSAAVVASTGNDQQENIINQWPILIWVVLILLLLLFILLTIVAFHQIRHHSKQINEPSNDPSA